MLVHLGGRNKKRNSKLQNMRKRKKEFEGIEEDEEKNIELENDYKSDG